MTEKYTGKVKSKHITFKIYLLATKDWSRPYAQRLGFFRFLTLNKTLPIRLQSNEDKRIQYLTKSHWTAMLLKISEYLFDNDCSL